MRVLVLSDIHGQETVLHNILRREISSGAPPDYVLFLGDGLREFDALTYYGEFAMLPALAVRGNCDFFGSSDTPDLRELTLAEHRIMMMHGHRFEVKSGLDRTMSFAAAKKQELVLFGHTHIQKEIRFSQGELVDGMRLDRPLILFNPGNVSGGYYGVVTLSPDGIVCEHKRA